MNRDKQEMALWREAYTLAISQGASYGDADEAATTAAESFCKRYPPQPTVPPAVWYDKPPRPGEYFVEGLPRVCWVEEDVVYYPAWNSAGEHPRIVEASLAGRRVSPIIKPPEPTT